jgi:hypothetical protein
MSVSDTPLFPVDERMFATVPLGKAAAHSVSVEVVEGFIGPTRFTVALLYSGTAVLVDFTFPVKVIEKEELALLLSETPTPG